MEPFGLFHLLQSLADALPKNGENPPPDPDIPPPVLEENPPQKEEGNACAEFLAMHEARAGRMRRR